MILQRVDTPVNSLPPPWHAIGSVIIREYVPWNNIIGEMNSHIHGLYDIWHEMLQYEIKAAVRENDLKSRLLFVALYV